MKQVDVTDLSDSLAQPYGQCAALCWRLHLGRVQVLLITSRDTGRWVIPKGWPVAGLGPAESAAREAWEEAGVEGSAGQAPIGHYDYDKLRPEERALPCRVAVFALRVRALKARFPERKQRRRKWIDAAKAAAKVAEPALAALLQAVAADPALLKSDAGSVRASAKA